MIIRKQNFLDGILAATLATMLYVPCVQADYTAAEPQKEGSITYITGGIGDEEREVLKSVKNDYNLSIMSAGTSGAFVGDTHIVIHDRTGQEVLNTDAGPLFYAKLPAGRYIVEGTSEGQTRKQAINVASHQPAHVHFSWK